MSAEPGRVFVDSNLFVYAYDTGAGTTHERARSLIDSIWREQRGALSIQVLQEFFVTVTRKLKRSVPVPDARRIVVNLSRWRTHEPGVDDVVEAIDIHRDHKIAFWDALIIRSASQLGCEVVLTEDLNSGQTYRGVRAENPFS